MSISEWHGCYDDSWKGIICEEAFSHPAKISYALAARIYEHAFKSGWLNPGDTVVDPFGGIGGTAIHAACQGVKWVGCELEPKFHAMAEQNFALWRDRWGHCPEWVQPKMYCGDSRRLAEVLGMADVCVSSPPFFTPQTHDRGHIMSEGTPAMKRCKNSVASAGYIPERSPGQLGSMPEGDYAAVVASPPYSGDSGKGDRTGHERAARRAEETGYRQGLGCFKTSEAYGRTDGQLGGMAEGEPPAVVVSSPPFSGTEQPCASQTRAIKDYHAFTRGDGTKRDETLTGQTPGQLGAMVVGSPPFEQSADAQRTCNEYGTRARQSTSERGAYQPKYGLANGNIGNQSGETFWSAARDILIQCHLILRPGGMAIWVCKDFVRKGARVPFSDQWLALCESIGFRLECRHRAMLVKRGRKQKLLDGGEHEPIKERKSFFRRLAERRGSPKIDWEDIICVRKL